MSNNHEYKKDEVTGAPIKDHEWDGIQELDNPLPRWWVWVYVICIIYAVGYWVVYPAWPTIKSHTTGIWNWTQYVQLDKQQQEIIKLKEKYLERFEKASLQEIWQNDELREFAVVGGKIAFKDTCAMCHGLDAAGSKGFPNLNDDDWIWGGKLEDIYTTIKYGIRSGDPSARDSQMPSFGKDGILTKEQISDVADYVMSLSTSSKADVNSSGGKVYVANCAVCHGNNGEGNQALGAPRLNDDIWLYGGDKESIEHTIYYSRAGVMPHFGDRLGDVLVKQLAIYVYSLGGGQK